MKKLHLIICALTLNTFSFSTVPTTGLIARWEFNNNLQDGTGTNHGTWQGPGNPVFVPDRCLAPQSAISFNGVNQFIQMATAGISGSGARSLSFWMRTNNNNFGGPNVVRAMFNDGQFSPGPNAGTRWEINHNYQCQGLGVDISMQFITRPTICINDGTWHHVVVTQAANSALSTISIYIDGNLIVNNCSPTGNTAINNTIAQAITIGAVPAAPGGRYFQGALDDFYYYNVVLTPAQVTELYWDKCNITNSTCGTPPPLTITPTGGCCLGNACGAAANPLTSSWEIPLAGRNFIFREATGSAGRVGIGAMVTACTPGNLLEVRRGTTSSVSGLRLTDLVGAPPATSSGRVLSVNANGDVILVPDAVGVGGMLVGAQNGLSVLGNMVELGGVLYKNTNINLAGFNLNYLNGTTLHKQRGANGGTWQFALGANNKDGQASFSDVVHATGTVGWNTGRLLHVNPLTSAVAPSSSGLVGDMVRVTGTALTGGGGIAGTTFGYYAISENKASTSGGNYAIVGQADGTGGPSALNIGVKAMAGDGNHNYCVYAEIQGKPAAAEDNGVRVHSQSNGGTVSNRAGNFKALYGQNVIGVYAEAAGGSVSNWAGYFQGNVNINGQVWGSQFSWTSDERFKNNIKKLESVTEKLSKVTGYTYTYKTDEFKDRNFPSTEQIGFLAQELKEEFPQLVSTDDKGYYAVNYVGMIPVLLEAVKEQQKQIDEKSGITSDTQKQLDEQKKINDELKAQNTLLTNRLDKLEQMISACCTNNATGKSGSNQLVNLSDKNVIVLNQNVPNPFAESTVITYEIPTDFNKAQITFSTSDGKIIKTVDVTTKGQGRLNVFANDLTHGFYSYTLVVDGKIIDTKKMVRD